jgi:hypothetical protein
MAVLVTGTVPLTKSTIIEAGKFYEPLVPEKRLQGIHISSRQRPEYHCLAYR